MEETSKIFSYLPLHYKNIEEVEYVQYLCAPVQAA